MRIIDLILSVTLVAGFDSVLSAPVNDKPRPPRSPLSLQDTVRTWYQHDRSQLLHLMRAEFIQDLPTLNMLEEYEQQFTSPTHKMSYEPPNVSQGIWDTIGNKGFKDASALSTSGSFSMAWKSWSTRYAIEYWWQNESRVTPIWFAWVMTRKPDQRFPGHRNEMGFVRLPWDLFAVPSTFEGPERDEFLESFIALASQSDNIWLIIKYGWLAPPSGMEKYYSREKDPLSELNDATDIGQRLQAYRNLDDTQKAHFNEIVFRRKNDVWAQWWLTEHQAFTLGKMIAIASGPQRSLGKHPEQKFKGLKEICDTKWKSLNWEDKLILRESVLAMTSHWEAFNKNVLDDPHGYIDG
ncbi:hypothetical protein FRB97_005214 [Tulasnella sp. 331]|nr:hypothetical protein FRB97_005214 [Tulasnella sp. 331]